MMESFTVPALAAAVVALAGCICYAIFRRPAPKPGWPKVKQYEAYRQNVTPIKKRLHSITIFDDFTPVGEKVPVQNLPTFFARHGKEFCVYTVDWEQEAVVLVRPVEGADLKKHPFFSEAQRQSAAEVLVVPIEKMQAVVDVISDEVAHVQEVFVFSTARCGSTLLIRAVEASSVAQVASEPISFDLIFHQIIRLRQGRTSPDGVPAVLQDEETAVSLLRNVVCLLNYYLVTSDQQHRSVIFYKFMAQSILVGDLVYRAFPAAKTVFLYRNGLEVYESWIQLAFKYRIVYAAFKLAIRLGVRKLGPEVEMFSFFNDQKYSTVRCHGSPLYLLMTLWVGAMHRAAELQRERPGYFFHAVIHYPALVRGKEEAIRQMIEKLGIEWKKERAEEERIRSAFVGDSQEGALQSSGRSRAGEKWRPPGRSWLGDWEREFICDVCRKSGNEILGPDVILPNTMT